MTQRVIKFRAWHNEAKAMLQVGDNHGTTHPLDCAVYARQGQDVVLMLWTGMVDKHGKEIYEGDIRKEMLDGLFVGDPQREHYFVMVYIQEWTMFAWLSINSGEYHKYLREGASALDTEMYWTYPAGQDEPNNVELVGNIYTTPELVDPKMIENGNS